MADDLDKLWSSVQLTEDEIADVEVEGDWEDGIRRAGQSCLIGRILTRRAVNVEAMRFVFHKVWKLQGGLTIKEIGEKIFVFQFDREVEKDRVLFHQPWSFNRALVVLMEFDGLKPLDSYSFDQCPFWVQVHGLPLGLMNDKIGATIGGALGTLEEVATDEGGAAWGKWLRLRVRMDIRKPLRRGMSLKFPGLGKVLVGLKYERLPDFCFVCGKLCHHESDCDEAIRMKKLNGHILRDYGAWLRAEAQRSSHGGFDGAGPSFSRNLSIPAAVKDAESEGFGDAGSVAGGKVGSQRPVNVAPVFVAPIAEERSIPNSSENQLLKGFGAHPLISGVKAANPILNWREDDVGGLSFNGSPPIGPDQLQLEKGPDLALVTKTNTKAHLVLNESIGKSGNFASTQTGSVLRGVADQVKKKKTRLKVAAREVGKEMLAEDSSAEVRVGVKRTNSESGASEKKQRRVSKNSCCRDQ